MGEVEVLTLERTRERTGQLPVLERKNRQGPAVDVPGAPAIPDLAFRGFQGERDYPAMVSVLEGSKDADGLERVDTVADVARAYQHLVHSDPVQDMLFVELRGCVIGYSRVWWEQEGAGQRLYSHFAHLLPAWRGLGIRRAMVRHNERWLRQIATHLPGSSEAFRKVEGYFGVWASGTEAHWHALLAGEGYRAARYHLDMVCPALDGGGPDLECVPDLPLPVGLEVRPVRDGQLLRVRDAAQEAFRDGWGETEADAARFEEWRASPGFRPELWQVAWDGDQVAGGVLNYVDGAENEEYGRLRGYTENVFVCRPWRRRGLARALLARSLRMLGEMGLEEAALGVDAENAHGARKLYESLGFREVQRHTLYRKAL